MSLLTTRPRLSAAAAGLILTLAIPPISLAPAAFVALALLITLINRAPTAREAAWRALLFGIAHHTTGLYWITSAVLVEAASFWWAIPIAVPLLAAVLASFIAIPAAIARATAPGLPRILMFAGAWTLGDLARQFVLTGFPWNPLASIWEMPGTLGLIMMQPAAWVGAPGLTFATVLIAGLFTLTLTARIIAAQLLASWAIIGWQYLHIPPGEPPDLTAVLVQGNVSELDHRDHYQDPDWAGRIFARHLQLTRQGMAQIQGHPGVVIWPETASPYWLDQSPEARQYIAQAARPAITLAGSARLEAPQIAHNSLIAVMPDGAIGGFYDKTHLVPYGEYFPSYLPIRLGEQGWAPGAGLKTLHIPGLPPIGPLICYEAAFPAQTVVEADRPHMLVNITNDSWFGNSAGPRQHLAAARLRAVEEGLPVLRAANTGISAIIDSHGRVVDSLGLDRAGVLTGRIPGYLPPTPFAALGLRIAGLSATLSCFLALFLARARALRHFMA